MCVDQASSPVGVHIVAPDKHPGDTTTAVMRDTRLRLVGNGGYLPRSPLLDPSVVVLDTLLHGPALAVVCRSVSTRSRDMRLIVRGARLTDRDVSVCFANGAAGVVDAESPHRHLGDAILQVASGAPYVDRRVTAVIIGLLVAMERGGVSRGLTPQEVRILRLLPSGLTNRELARQLEVSPNTLKSHLRNTYRKLGVSNRVAAISEGRRVGLLAPEPPAPEYGLTRLDVGQRS